MDTILCDELLQEVFHRLPPRSSPAVALVSRRWRRLLRSSTSCLSVRFPPHYDAAAVASFSAFLARHAFLSSLSVTVGGGGEADALLLAVAAACPNLRLLRFLCSRVSPVSLCTLSSYCVHLSSIDVTVARPLNFNWLTCFNSLKSLSVSIANPSLEIDYPEVRDGACNWELNLESLSLCGILPGDYGITFLWRSCRSVKKLQLMNCESLGDNSTFSGLLRRLMTSLKELELRTCRSIVDVVLLTLAETCVSLESLLVHDGGSREGLLHFLTHRSCSLTRLDLRLPLDLDNTHLTTLARNPNFRGLVSLRLQSCCLVAGEGLVAVARAMADALNELALINCDIVGREPGLLTALGQSLKRLRKVDLSYNSMLVDKELLSMLASSNCLVELNLRGCDRLTDAAIASIVRSCVQLKHVDVSYCSGIQMDGIELLVMNCRQLRHVEVEQSKLSEAAKAWASTKLMEVVGLAD